MEQASRGNRRRSLGSEIVFPSAREMCQAQEMNEHEGPSIRSRGVQDRLRRLAESQLSPQQVCSESLRGGVCGVCNSTIKAGDTECVITDGPARVVLDRGC